MEDITAIIPLFERILVLPDEVVKKTGTGIIIPADSRKRPTTGTVVSLGHLVTESKAPIKIGDTVMYLRYSGMPIELDGKEYALIMVNDLVAIIDNSKGKVELKEY